MWWWKVAMHLDEAQLALANAMAHNVDDPRLAYALYGRLRDGQAILLEIFRAKGLLPGANGKVEMPHPEVPMPEVPTIPMSEVPEMPMPEVPEMPMPESPVVSAPFPMPEDPVPAIPTDAELAPPLAAEHDAAPAVDHAAEVSVDTEPKPPTVSPEVVAPPVLSRDTGL